jgi:hypothetical protein
MSEILLVPLNPDEALAGEDRCDAGGAAAHERVEDSLGGDGVAEVSHLLQRTRARNGVAAQVAVPGAEIGHVPVARQFVAQQMRVQKLDPPSRSRTWYATWLGALDAVSAVLDFLDMLVSLLEVAAAPIAA